MSVVLIVGTAKGGILARSEDRVQWQVSNLFLPGWMVTATAQTKDGKFFAAVASDVFGAAVMTSEDLKTWTQLEQAPAYEPGLKGNEDHNRIIRSLDFGGMYAEGHRYIDQIWKLHAVGNDLYAGVSEAGLFKSADGGETWDSVDGLNNHQTRDTWMPGAGGLCAHTILVDENDPDRIWVGISAAGVFRTDDGGKTWISRNEGVSAQEGYCIHCLAHDPQNADVIYRQDHRGMYLTENGGDSWRLIENGLPQATLSDDHVCVFGFPVVYDPKSKSAFAIPLDGENFRFPHEGKLRVFRTRDQGESWQSVSNGLPETSYSSILRGAMCRDDMDPCGVYFGSTAGEVFLSNDCGDHWQKLPQTFPRVLSVNAYEMA